MKLEASLTRAEGWFIFGVFTFGLMFLAVTSDSTQPSREALAAKISELGYLD